MYAERKTVGDINAFREQFNRMDNDKDGFLTKLDLVRSLSMAPLLAEKMIVHLHKGRKDAEKISFDRFIQSRLRYDLSQKTQAVFDEISSSANSMSITISHVTDFANSQFSFQIDFSSGSLEKVFETFGNADRCLTYPAFSKVMNVRTIPAALGLNC